MAGMVESVNKLGEAARPSSRRRQPADHRKMKGMDMSKQLEAAEVKEDGDTATVANAQSPSHPYKLKKVGGEWKLTWLAPLGRPPGRTSPSKFP